MEEAFGVLMAKQKKRSKFRRLLLIVVGLPLLALILSIGYIQGSTFDHVYTKLNDLPEKPFAIVPGAGLRPGGKPSLILQARLDGAIDLYRFKIVRKLLMSGDNRTKYYNEPAAMRQYALEQGVPSKDILLDFAGRDTYDTCYRAKAVFGCKSAVVVTQQYHASRAVFLARSFGIDAVAYAVPNLTQFPALQFNYTLREYLADLKALWDVNISHRDPYVDSQKPIRGSPHENGSVDSKTGEAIRVASTESSR
ncbi:MAG TPA: ElyC/SanA/YdcF family protein [Fimbriimonas sp.]|nr:ElyC/SanA/YdcF family protein [Fimbriimonas sp.]